MSQIFKPRKEILPLAQQRLWPELANTADLGFVLYGGTAIALRLGHRQSVDFDFFSAKPLDREAITAALPFLEKATTVKDQLDTWTVLTASTTDNPEGVKLSFFGSIKFVSEGTPELTEDRVLWVAALDELMATKVKVVLQRSEVKDYRDVAAMIEAGVSLSKGLETARKYFGPNFQPSESLKALVYFGDGNLSKLMASEKATLVKAAAAVRGRPQDKRSDRGQER